MMDSIFGTSFNQIQRSNIVNQQRQPSSLSEEQFQTLIVELRMAMNQMAASGQNLWNAVDARLEQDAKARRKERKSGTVAWAAVLDDRLSYIQNFEDGSQKILDLTLNFVPDYEIRKFQFALLCEETGYVGIYFKSADFWIIKPESEFNGKSIREAMIKGGVVFNAQLSESKVEKLLASLFLPQISAARNVIQVPALAGWNEKIYMTKERLPYRKNEGLPILPIYTKSMAEYTNIPICTKEYFKQIRGVFDWRNRVWFMLYPLAGILSSILEKGGISLKRYLNLVVLSDIPAKEIGNFFQLFNRNRLGLVKINEEGVIVAKDEVLLLDAREEGIRSDYKNKKYAAWCEAIVKKVLQREFVTEAGYRVCTPSVVISNGIARNRYAINLFVDESFFGSIEISEMNDEKDVNGIVYWYMIRFFEQKYDEIVRIISKAKQNNLSSPEGAWLEAVGKIADKFWLEYGIDMRKMANIPNWISWTELIDDTLLLRDNLVEDFVTIMRKGVRNWVVREKRYGKGCPEEICYNEKWLFVPTVILNRILMDYGIESNRKYLIELREKGYLRTDDRTSLSRQIQVRKKCVEMYQIDRKIFERPGLPDIVDLGKEENDV